MTSATHIDQSSVSAPAHDGGATMMTTSLQKPVQAAQPPSHQAMDPQRPHAETQEEPQLTLRGGDDCGGYCRGRFCFIIPCPIPINCCIFPCPC